MAKVVAPNTEEIFERIEKLANLRSIGAISEEEFSQKKKELLSRI